MNDARDVFGEVHKDEQRGLLQSLPDGLEVLPLRVSDENVLRILPLQKLENTLPQGSEVV